RHRRTFCSDAGPACKPSTSESHHAGPVILKLIDTYHGLDWDGPGPVPRVYGLDAAKLRPKRGIFRKERSLPTTMRAQAPGPIPKEIMMRFYNQSHSFYCGIDLHASTMYLCILDQGGTIALHKDVPTNPDAFLEAIAPYRDNLVVGCECLFCWYWLADLCHDQNIAFVLGHALYMRAIYGAKTKDDEIDSEKIARLLRGGNLPYAYVYPKGLRETRDLLRRRMYLVRKRAELITHVVNTNTQYNLPPFGKKLMYARNRKELNILKRFSDPSVRTNIALDLRLLDTIDELINDVELYLTRTVKIDQPQWFFLLNTIPGVGKILALVLLYEIHDIRRFADEGQFLSYARLIRPVKRSAGKVTGGGGAKIGNAYLKWAFSE